MSDPIMERIEALKKLYLKFEKRHKARDEKIKKNKKAYQAAEAEEESKKKLAIARL